MIVTIIISISHFFVILFVALMLIYDWVVGFPVGYLVSPNINGFGVWVFGYGGFVIFRFNTVYVSPKLKLY